MLLILTVCLPSRIGTLHTMKFFTFIGQVSSMNLSPSIMSTSIIMPSTSAVMPTSSSTTPPATTTPAPTTPALTTPAPKFKVKTTVYDDNTGKPCLWFRANMRVNYHNEVCFLNVEIFLLLILYVCILFKYNTIVPMLHVLISMYF